MLVSVTRSSSRQAPSGSTAARWSGSDAKWPMRVAMSVCSMGRTVWKAAFEGFGLGRRGSSRRLCGADNALVVARENARYGSAERSA